MIIPIGVTAKNEANFLPHFLETLKSSVACAQKRIPVQFEIHILLNDNTDNSEDYLAQEKNLSVWKTTGGLIEAQRFLWNLKRESPFLIFSDADILVGEEAIAEITEALLQQPLLQVAYVEKYPLRPVRSSLLAQALYLYNLNNGYQDRRNYLNGQLFAIRNWNIPKPEELEWSTARDSNFLNLKAGIRCDDIYISRDLLQRLGPASLSCVDASLWYKPPETLQGMYRKYQRMRLEIERLHCFFPDSIEAHQKWGRRRFQKKLIISRPLGEIFYYGVFHVFLSLCKAFYRMEKLYYSYFSSRVCPTWKPVSETKRLYETLP